jgi:hypothetical protein
VPSRPEGARLRSRRRAPPQRQASDGRRACERGGGHARGKPAPETRDPRAHGAPQRRQGFARLLPAPLAVTHGLLSERTRLLDRIQCHIDIKINDTDRLSPLFWYADGQQNGDIILVTVADDFVSVARRLECNEDKERFERS